MNENSPVHTSQQGEGSYHVLILEDDPAHVDMICTIFLSSQDRFRISVARNILEARRVIRNDPPHLILADWDLPDGKGIDLLPKKESLVSTPLIIMTGHGTEQIAVEMMKKGATDYIVKSEEVFRELPRICERAIRDWTNLVERKAAEKRAENALLRYRQVTESINASISCYDLNGTILYLNTLAASFLGGSPEEFVGRSIHEIFHRQQADTLVERIRNIRKNPQNPNVFEEKTIFSTGTYWFLSLFSPVIDTEGEVTAVHVISTDITKKKRDERKSLDTRRQLEDILNFLPDATFAIDNKGRVIVWNRAMEIMTDVSAQEIIGQGDYAYSIPFYGVKRPILIDLVLMENKEIEKKYPYIKRDGDVITSESYSPYCFKGKGTHLWGTASPLYDASQHIIGAIEVIRDITYHKDVEKALLASEKRFRELSDLLPQGIFESDANGILTYANRIAFTMFGYSEEIIEKEVNILGMIAPPDRQRATNIFLKIIAGESPPLANAEFLALRQDGSVFPLSIYASPILRDDRIVGIRGVVLDISERMSAEDALRASEARYRNIIEDQTEFICRFKPDGTHEFVNEAYATYFGKTPEELTGKIFRPNIFAEDRGKVRDFFKSLTPSHPVDYIEHRIIMQDGSVRWQRWSDRVIFDAAGSIHEYQSVGRDITEQKKVLEALQESEKKFRNLLENIPDLVMVHQDGLIVYVNPAMVKTMGITPEEALNTPLMNYIAPEYHERVRSAIRARMAQQFLEPYEIEIISPSRRRRWVEVRGTLIEFDGANASLNVLTDITDRKLSEKAFQESEQKHRQLFETMAQGTLYYDSEGRIVDANPAAVRILGIPYSQLIGKTNEELPWSVIHEDGRDYSFDRFPSSIACKTGRKGTGIMGIFNPWDRTVHWILVNAVSLSQAGEKAKYQVVVTFEDITGLKNAESSLREREAILETIMDAADETIALIDSQGTIISINESGAKRFGRTVAELTGICAYDLLPGDIAGPRKKAIESVFETGIPSTIDDSREGMFVHNEINPVFDPDHTYVERVAIFATDITERKRMEDAIKESEKRYEEILNNAIDSIFIIAVTEEGRFRIQYANPACQENMGITRESAKDRYIEEVLPEPNVKSMLSECRKCAETGYYVRYEDTYFFEKGGRFFSTTLVPLVNPDGNVARIIAISHDITSRRQMESEIRSLNRSLEQRVEERTTELKQANLFLKEEISQKVAAEEQLQASLNEKMTLLKEVHHRVKNNLQIIVSLLNLQSQYITDESVLAVIRESQNRVRAMALVHEKLYQTRDISKIDLGEYIRFLAESLFQSYGARSRKIGLNTDIKEIHVDINTAIPFGLIMNELISNSLKYAFPEGMEGKLEITITTTNELINVVCRDNGVGIPADLDWRNTQSLGLRLVNSLVEQLNGTIDLDMSAGTQFTLTLKEKE